MHARDGAYVRTVYPFPADKLEKVSGLTWRDFPHGFRAPLKAGMYQQSLLTYGRILSVKLDYHAEEKVPLRDVPGMDSAPSTR